MTENRARDLTLLTGALYERERLKMQNLNREEARLRQDLTRLDAHRLANRDLPDPQLQGFREIGADLLWQGWIGRNRAGLQTDLARVLARKGQMMLGLRRAFGKHQAALSLQDAARDKARVVAQSREEQALARLAILQRITHP